MNHGYTYFDGCSVVYSQYTSDEVFVFDPDRATIGISIHTESKDKDVTITVEGSLFANDKIVHAYKLDQPIVNYNK